MKGPAELFDASPCDPRESGDPALGPRWRGCNPISILRLPPAGPKIRGRSRAPLGVSGRVSDPAAGKLVLKVPISKLEGVGRRLDYIPLRGNDETAHSSLVSC